MDKVNDAVTGCKRPLLGMTLPELEAVVKEAGLRPFAAKQMARRLYVGRAKNIDEMTELPKSARLWFAERYTIGRSVPKLESRSADGTVKYLFATRGEGVDYLTHGEGGRDVEAVYIPDKDRATLCVSSQAGCRMGCRFCMTGRQGYHGDLSSAGIINQILSIPESESLTNIVFMGMGEPMDNVAEVLKAVEVLTAPWGLHGARGVSRCRASASWTGSDGCSTRRRCMSPSACIRRSPRSARGLCLWSGLIPPIR